MLSTRAASAQAPSPGTPSFGAPAATAPPSPASSAAPATMALTPSPPSPALPVVTLAALERGAIARQPQVLIARSQTLAEEGVVQQARSGYLPQLTATGQYSFGTYHSASGVATSSPTAGGFWIFSLAASQLIYDFGQTIGKYDAAKDTVEADRATEKATVFQVLVNVRSAYFTARADKDLVGVQQETLTDQQRHLAQVKGFVDVGTQPQIALAQQQAAVASARVALITAQNNYGTAKAQLNQAAGVRGDTEYDVGDEQLPEVPDEDAPLETLMARAVAARPEIASYAKQRVAQNDTIAAAKGAYGPTISAFGNLNEYTDDLAVKNHDEANWSQPLWQVGGLLSWPFFQGGLTQGQVRQQEAILAGIDAQEANEILQVQLQVDSARLAVRASKASIGAAEDAERSSHEQLRLAEQRYATGVGSIIELNDAQVAYTTAAAQLVQARYQLASARAQLLAALGRT